MPGSLIFIDCEGHGPCPTCNDVTSFEFGAVEFKSQDSFHGIGATKQTFLKFEEWLNKYNPCSMVSDNPAYDWQFINFYFHTLLGRNPLGHSARRISDFYAGLVGDFHETQKWKRLRVTKHDHNPVHDALGNVEAFKRLLNGER